MSKLNQSFWKDLYRNETTPWDLGKVSPPLKNYIDSIKDKNLRILIPGAGRAYEAIYLHKLGFTNVFVCDWAKEAFQFLEKECPDFPKEHLIVEDFFKIEIKVDLILEQTFFCAINPNLRYQYAKKCSEILVQGGKIAGLMFGIIFPFEGPPFGGEKGEYERIFQPYYNIQKMEVAEDSIGPRKGNELWVEMRVIG